MTKYGQIYNKANNQTSQRDFVPSRAKEQARNNAGGVAFKLDKWKQLERFLILGVEGNTYYQKASALTLQNTSVAQACLKEDGLRFVRTIVDVLGNRRAPKPAPGLFLLTMALKLGNLETRKEASRVFNDCVKTGTHLFSTASDVSVFGGWGRLTRETFAKWYTDKSPDALAYQLLKYRQRNGWTHRDVLRKAHPVSNIHDSLFKYATQSTLNDGLPSQVLSFERAKNAKTSDDIVNEVRSNKLTWEMVDNKWLKTPSVWLELIKNMPIHATLRNLGRLSSLGLTKPMSQGERTIIDNINNRVHSMHPLQVLVALNTYRKGHGVKGNLTWDVSQSIVDALDEGFYKAFDSIEPSGKRIGLFLDVSVSMTWSEIAGMTGVTPRTGSAVMAMATLRAEKNAFVYGFSGNPVAINIGRRDGLDTVVDKIERLRAGATDCSLPMTWAMEHNVEIDTFVIYTDNETWAGHIHPYQALQQYRKAMGIDAQLIVVGMTSTGFTIADPQDEGMLDVVGFDSSAPNVMSAFSRREF